MDARPSPPSASPEDDVTPSPSDRPAPPGNYPVGEGGPVFCLVASLRDGFAGGVLGSVFGFGQGLWKRQGFKGSLKEAGSSAKTFALLSGVHTLVSCCLRKIRGKHDAINAGIAGCATGLALSTPGNLDAMLRSCVTFAAFSYVTERFSRPEAAMASSLDEYLVSSKEPGERSGFSFGVLPPFVLPPAFLGTLELSNRVKISKYTQVTC